MRKRFVPSMLSALLFALCVPAQAQQTGKIPRIGYLSAASSPSPAFMQGLHDLGYVEGPPNVLARADKVIR